MGTRLLLGRYQDVLQDIVCDTLVADPPYSARTHRGHDNRPKPGYFRVSSGRPDSSGLNRRDLSYGSWSENDVAEFARSWAPRTRGWACVFSDDVLSPVWRRAMEDCGRYAFAPVPCVIRGMTVRMSGDGPSSWAVYLNVSRPRSPDFVGRAKPRGGTRPGAYVLSGRGGAREREHIGGKPLELMLQVLRDYALPGDLVCDPCAGYATTGVAALALDMRFVGAEADPATCLRGVERLQRHLGDAGGPAAPELAPGPDLEPIPGE